MNDKIKKVVVWRIISTIVATVMSYWYLGEIKKSIELTAILDRCNDNSTLFL